MQPGPRATLPAAGVCTPSSLRGAQAGGPPAKAEESPPGPGEECEENPHSHGKRSWPPRETTHHFCKHQLLRFVGCCF